MSFYQRIFLPDRPDLLPAPPPKGLRAVGSLLAREWRTLIKLGLLFFAASLPVVTVGPALAAVIDLLLRMVRDEPILLYPDFWQAMRRHARRGLLCTVALLVSSVLLVCALTLYARAYLAGQLLCLAPFMLACILTLIVLVMSPYVLLLCTQTALPLGLVFWNAALIGISHVPRTLAMLALAGAIGVPFLLIWPVSLPFFPLFLTIFQLLIVNWLGWNVIRGHLINEREETK